MLSLLVFVLSFIGGTFLLKKYIQKLLFKTETTIISDENQDNIDANFEISEKKEIDNFQESYDQKVEETSTENTYTVNVNPLEIEKNYKKWYDYTLKNIELSYEFTPVDNENVIIAKEDFLNKLKTGLYIPLKIEDDDTLYKLYKLSEQADKKIKKSIKSSSLVAYNYFKKEGQPLPDFNFTDLNGNNYSKKNVKGKIQIIKCWFINCVVCVQEFPELNELYDRYEGNENVIFLSLAFDKPEKLKIFLAKKAFRFPVIAEQKKYMTKELEIKQYPTHIIVDEDGNIVKMVSNVKALVFFVNQLVVEEDFSSEED